MPPVKIIFEDRDLLVVEKSAGMVVNRSESCQGLTIQDWMEKKYPGIFSETKRAGAEKNGDKKEFIQRSGVVHRLDKETSGVLLLAKNESAFVEFKRQFKARKVEKSYLALLSGRISPKEGNIKLPLGRNPKCRKRFAIRLGGRRAVTFYKVKGYYTRAGRTYSLVKVKPKTGRTHQIRVHFKFLGHPLVGDPLYAGKHLKRERVWCPRLFLHADSLIITHPRLQRKKKFSAKLPPDLQKAMKVLSKTSA